jgi:hypothetical protein
VILKTFEHVPWNAPSYARHAFVSSPMMRSDPSYSGSGMRKSRMASIPNVRVCLRREVCEDPL